MRKTQRERLWKALREHPAEGPLIWIATRQLLGLRGGGCLDRTLRRSAPEDGPSTCEGTSYNGPPAPP